MMIKNIEKLERFKDDFYQSIAFSESEVDPLSYMIFSLSSERNEEDAKLGMAGMHLEIDSQLNSSYNGIKKILISGQNIDIEIFENSMEALGLKQNTIGIRFRDGCSGDIAEAINDIQELARKADIELMVAN